MKNFWIKFSVWLVQGGVTSMTFEINRNIYLNFIYILISLNEISYC